MKKPLKEQLKRIGGMKLNEIQVEVELIHDMEAHIFDVILKFQKTYEKSHYRNRWRRTRKF